MRRFAFCVVLAIAIAAVPAKGQEQTTLGACSPAINRVGGNVAVTCVTAEHRIRIAKFSGDDTLKTDELAEFIELNSGQVIYLDVWLNSFVSSLLYDGTIRKLFVPFVECNKDLFCLFGVSSIDVYFTETNNVENTIKYRDYWRFRGYYLIESNGCRGVSPNKTCDYRLRAIDDKIIALSDKYDTR